MTQPHDRLTDELYETCAAQAAGALDPAEASEFNRHLAICPLCRAEVDSYRPSVAAFVEAVEPLVPPASIKESLMARIRKMPFVLLRKDAGGWEPAGAPGVEIRRLSIDASGYGSFLARMAPGAAYPAHRHDGVEECIVLEGDLYTQEVDMRAGDYIRLDRGSVHSVQRTRGGCVLMVIGSLHSEPVGGASV